MGRFFRGPFIGDPGGGNGGGLSSFSVSQDFLTAEFDVAVPPAIGISPQTLDFIFPITDLDNIRGTAFELISATQFRFNREIGNDFVSSLIIANMSVNQENVTVQLYDVTDAVVVHSVTQTVPKQRDGGEPSFSTIPFSIDRIIPNHILEVRVFSTTASVTSLVGGNVKTHALDAVGVTGAPVGVIEFDNAFFTASPTYLFDVEATVPITQNGASLKGIIGYNATDFTILYPKDKRITLSPNFGVNTGVNQPRFIQMRIQFETTSGLFMDALIVNDEFAIDSEILTRNGSFTRDAIEFPTPLPTLNLRIRMSSTQTDTELLNTNIATNIKGV